MGLCRYQARSFAQEFLMSQLELPFPDKIRVLDSYLLTCSIHSFIENKEKNNFSML